ncbi:hypothetical protein T265_08586 [Opisthorchis viverrini]|uniref:Uncharacterized protein n=1 Tax=Opisthorchis viverrini TaxID=6198 RepID=A0A074ZD14_OPIVI|nr:hypothetical protein T265_08586 [Opisthorchis viverrini]KER23542.1 hypothetical protein T265_08586 [Opisthorchis viverrini]
MYADGSSFCDIAVIHAKHKQQTEQGFFVIARREENGSKKLVQLCRRSSFSLASECESVGRSGTTSSDVCLVFFTVTLEEVDED